MSFKTPEIQYNGKIREIKLGYGDKSVTAGEKAPITSILSMPKCRICR
jgi:hypothetical protein